MSAEIISAPILKVIAQRHECDCGVAALAMLLGVSYEDALVAVAAEAPDVLTSGVWIRQLIKAAARLGYRLTRRRAFDIEEDTGLLNLSSRLWLSEHVVVLRAGLVVETDGTLWDADDFLKTQQARPGTLLVADAADTSASRRRPLKGARSVVK